MHILINQKESKIQTWMKWSLENIFKLGGKHFKLKERKWKQPQTLRV